MTRKYTLVYAVGVFILGWLIFQEPETGVSNGFGEGFVQRIGGPRIEATISHAS